MKPAVYIETSIPSFYFETRTNPAAVARRDWTRQWWDNQRGFYEVYTSVAVKAELLFTPQPKQNQCLQFIHGLPKLHIDDEIRAITQVYIRNKIMPANANGDALHLALASYYECRFLLTWNCTHLANANKFGHISRINTTLGLKSPLLITPLELLGEIP
jgi:hypothetical protein